MAVVTDKQYYLDNLLLKNLDFCIKRQKKNFDHLIILDGEEGYGKTTFSFAIAYYLAEQSGATFNLKENIFFDLDKLLERASRTEKQVFIWDEAAMAALSTEWQNKVQKKLIKMLMVARKKGHFWIFNIPRFYKLTEYISYDRAICLIHVYSSDNMNRGNFVFFGKKKKNRLIDSYRSSKKREYSKFDFAGKFTNTTHIVDAEEYDKMKDAAIRSIFEETEVLSHRQKELIKLKYNLARYIKEKGDSYKSAGKFFDYERHTIPKWLLFPEKYPLVWGNGTLERGGLLSSMGGKSDETIDK